MRGWRLPVLMPIEGPEILGSHRLDVAVHKSHDNLARQWLGSRGNILNCGARRCAAMTRHTHTRHPFRPRVDRKRVIKVPRRGVGFHRIQIHPRPVGKHRGHHRRLNGRLFLVKPAGIGVGIDQIDGAVLYLKPSVVCIAAGIRRSQRPMPCCVGSALGVAAAGIALVGRGGANQNVGRL